MTKFPLLLLVVSVFATATAAQTFRGYPCTSDGSGHQAGYEWAEENSISDPDSCDGNSDSFIEGCRAWAEEQQAEDNDSGNDEADEEQQAEDNDSGNDEADEE